MTFLCVTFSLVWRFEPRDRSAANGPLYHGVYLAKARATFDLKDFVSAKVLKLNYKVSIGGGEQARQRNFAQFNGHQELSLALSKVNDILRDIKLRKPKQ